jgi:hypothetical protein
MYSELLALSQGGAVASPFVDDALKLKEMHKELHEHYQTFMDLTGAASAAELTDEQLRDNLDGNWSVEQLAGIRAFYVEYENVMLSIDDFNTRVINNV